MEYLSKICRVCIKQLTKRINTSIVLVRNITKTFQKIYKKQVLLQEVR